MRYVKYGELKRSWALPGRPRSGRSQVTIERGAGAFDELAQPGPGGAVTKRGKDYQYANKAAPMEAFLQGGRALSAFVVGRLVQYEECS